MHRRILLLGVSLISSVFFRASAFADTYVKCAESVDADDLTVSGYVLEMSTRPPDVYEGPVGVRWNLKLTDEDSQWMPFDPNVVASTQILDGAKQVTIEFKDADGGTTLRYQIQNFDAEAPKLEKTISPGVPAKERKFSYPCVSAND